MGPSETNRERKTNKLFDIAYLNGSLFYDPYPIYAVLRDYTPVAWSKLKETWLITKYEDIEKGPRLPEITAKRTSIQASTLPDQLKQPLEAFYSGWLMYQEPPEHTRLRKTAQLLFSHSHLDKVSRNIEEYSRELIRQQLQMEAIDIVAFGHILGLRAVCYLLEIEPQNYGKVELWSQNIVDFMQGRYEDQILSGHIAATTITNLTSYLRQHIEFRSRYEDSVYSNFVRVSRTSHSASDDELILLLANILMDGHEPIANAIANAVILLSNQPNIFYQLKQNLDLLPDAVEEFLRMDPPFQYVVRYAGHDCRINGEFIAMGERILFITASANRDADVFPYPDTFDLRNNSKVHKTFGFGHHYCIGALLAKKVVGIALGCLIENLSGVHLSNTVPLRHHSLGSRALSSLVIRI